MTWLPCFPTRRSSSMSVAPGTWLTGAVNEERADGVRGRAGHAVRTMNLTPADGSGRWSNAGPNLGGGRRLTATTRPGTPSTMSDLIDSVSGDLYVGDGRRVHPGDGDLRRHYPAARLRSGHGAGSILTCAPVPPAAAAAPAGTGRWRMERPLARSAEAIQPWVEKTKAPRERGWTSTTRWRWCTSDLGTVRGVGPTPTRRWRLNSRR